MSYDPKKRDSSWLRVAPGMYEDPKGYMHVFPDEICAHLQVLFPEAGFDVMSKEDYDLIVQGFMDAFRTGNPGMEVMFFKHEREVD